jgi:hypothetical protein
MQWLEFPVAVALDTEKYNAESFLDRADGYRRRTLIFHVTTATSSPCHSAL